MKSPRKVLVLYEHGRAGAAAVDLARDLAEDESAALTIVAIAPQAPSGPRCGNSALEYNEVVADSVAHDLEQARERLGPAAAAGAAFVLLVEGADQTLEQLVRSGGFELVLLPGTAPPVPRAEAPGGGPAEAHRRRRDPDCRAGFGVAAAAAAARRRR